MVIQRAACVLLLGGIAACATTTNDRERAAPMPAVPANAMPANAMPASTMPATAMPQPASGMTGETVEAAPVARAAAAPEPMLAVAAAPVVAHSPAKPPRAEPKPAPAMAVAIELGGRLELVASGREGIAPGEAADGLVYFLPRSGGARPRPVTVSVDTRVKGFSPSVLVIPVGSTVRFPNRDTILHNVFSRTPGSSFDLGYFGPGETRQQVFSKPGLVIVNCNVHNNMRADVLVLATPYYTRPDRNGRYVLKDLPKGPGTLVFWHPRADAQQVAVVLPMAAPVSHRLVASKPSRHAGMGH